MQTQGHDGCVLSHVRLFVTLWTVASQAPMSMEFSRQEYWNGSPFPPPGDLPDPETEPTSPMSPASAAGFLITEPPAYLAPETKPRSEAESTFKIHPAYLNVKAL